MTGFVVPEIIFTHKTDAMRELLKLASIGYSHYTSGEVEPKKLQVLIYKFTDRYLINRTTSQACSAKKKGFSNVKLILWQNFDMTISFWLLATEGDNPVFALEQMKDLRNRKQRLSFEGYEIVKCPRIKLKTATDKKQFKARWTWRITKEQMSNWEERIKKAVRWKNDIAINQIIYSLQRIAGFSMSRDQGFDLIRLMKYEWKRAMKTEWAYNDIFIGWTGKFKKAEKITIAKAIKNKDKHRGR